MGRGSGGVCKGGTKRGLSERIWDANPLPGLTGGL